jgi:dihydropteroate synthase
MTQSNSKIWQLKTGQLDLASSPAIMGIVNVTPDSFSDGGVFFDPRKAIEHGLRLVAEGAAILDIGGESTRPYSSPVSEAEELRRVIPVIEELSRLTKTPLSIDTSKAKVAEEALAAGAEIINDVTGLEGDPRMLEVACRTGAGVCAMHMQGTPQTMQDQPTYQDVVGEILQYLRERQHQLLAAGIAAEKICLDPGIGFGKTHQHNLELIRRIDTFHQLGSPLLVGHSRKGFIGKLLEDQELNRDAGTLAVTLYLARQGIQIIRVHEVARTCQALKVDRALRESFC